jgi:GT2 family glycosyltransferase
MKYSSIVVTFNRLDLLKKNIEMQMQQEFPMDKIIIVNNASTDDTIFYLRELEKINSDKIDVLNLKENIGGAGGFSEGLKYAFQKGYDFFILMDDDGRPFDNYTFKELACKVGHLKSKNPLMMINSLVVNSEFKLSFGLKNIITIEEAKNSADIYHLIHGTINPFNGTLISKELISKIGFPNKNFFLKGDENDYQYRAQKANALIATVVNSFYMHPSPIRTTYCRFGKTKQIDIENPLKEYYKIRNYSYMYLKQKNFKSFFFFLVDRLNSLTINKNNPMKRLIYIFKGLFHAIIGKLGKYK